MGYDASLYVMKRKIIDREIKAFPGVPFSDLFGNRLFSWAYPDEYNIPEDEIGRCMFYTNRHTINHLKCMDCKCEDTIMVEYKKFTEMCSEVGDKLINTSLYVLVGCEEHELNELLDLVNLFKALMFTHIDWKTEVLVYSCG